MEWFSVRVRKRLWEGPVTKGFLRLELLQSALLRAAETTDPEDAVRTHGQSPCCDRQSLGDEASRHL
jgi:hypothetical protein